MRLGVFLPNWVGDVVMATPALRALRKHVGPAGSLVGIMRPYVSEVLAGCGWFNDIILYEKRARRRDWTTRAAIRNLRTSRLDCVVLLTNSGRTAWMAWRTARRRIGYTGQMRSLLLTDRLPNPLRRPIGEAPISTIDSYLRLAEAAGCAPEPPRMELRTLPADEQAADAVWRQLDLPVDNSVVVLNPGGAFGIAKHWPIEHFAALAQRIAADHDLRVVVNCGPTERDIARNIVDGAKDARVVSLADVDLLPIGLTKACIRRSQLLVTTDSGPRFLGVAFGKPVVSLFGPTDPNMTQTYSNRETCLSLSLDCQPCMARICPLRHHRCMRELTVDRVYAAVAHHLSDGHDQLKPKLGSNHTIPGRVVA